MRPQETKGPAALDVRSHMVTMLRLPPSRSPIGSTLQPMLASTLLLCLAFQGQPVHADLHPKNADFYVELADMGQLWPALEQAPLVRFLRDEDVKALLSGLGQNVDGPLPGLVQGLVQQSLPEWKVEAWFPALKSLSSSVVVLGPETETRAAFGSVMVIDFATPEAAQAFHGAIAAQAKKVEPHPSLAGVERMSAEKASEDGWCRVEGTRFVLGNSGSLPDDYVARAEKKSEGIAKAELFQKFGKLEAPKGTTLGWMLLARPLPDLLAATEDASDGPAEALRNLPSDLNPFGSARIARLQMVGGRYVTEMLAPKVAGDSEKALDAAWVATVPADAMLVYSAAFDGVAAAKTLRGLLGQSEELSASLAAIEQKLGFGLERVFSHLGPGMAVSMGTLSGLGLPEMKAFVDCADPAAFAKDVEAFCAALAESVPNVSAKTKGYKVKKAGGEEKVEIPVTTISLPPEFAPNPMIAISPSFAPAGGKLVFALNSMDVKNELKRLVGGDNGGLAADANPFARNGFTLPSGTTSAVVMDWAKLISGLIDMAKAFAPMMGAELPVDLNKLPSKEKVASFFAPTFHHARVTADGVYRRNEGSFGPETWFGVVGAAFFIGRQAQSQMMAPVEMEPVPAEPK